MIFGDLEFYIFLVAVLGVYYTVKNKGKWLVILAASTLFLGYLSPSFLVYTYIITGINYFLLHWLDKAPDKHRKWVYYSGMVLNIGQLVFFKYINFLIDNTNALVQVFYPNAGFQHLTLLAPIGISYYTFQCIAYHIDVYRKIEKPEKHFGVFSNYILFFPKILAGPIERTKNLLAALKKPVVFNQSLFHEGLIQLFWGLFKKLVVADRLVNLVDNVYGNIHEFQGIPLIIALVIQVFHIYCDFSGYTDIALGIAKLFGFRLINNFERPLFAQNVSMFWRKWHISLSNWCNDYIFKRILIKRLKWKKWAAVYSVFVTFLVIGIWHGANWNYILLGLLQGIAINYEFFTKKYRIRLFSGLGKYMTTLISRLVVFAFFGVTLIFFNAEKVSHSFYFLGNMFRDIKFQLYGYNLGMAHDDVIVALLGIIVVLFFDYANEKGILFRERLKNNRFARWSLYYLLVLSVLIFGKFGSTDFVYFQF